MNGLRELIGASSLGARNVAGAACERDQLRPAAQAEKQLPEMYREVQALLETATYLEDNVNRLVGRLESVMLPGDKPNDPALKDVSRQTPLCESFAEQRRRINAVAVYIEQVSSRLAV